MARRPIAPGLQPPQVSDLVQNRANAVLHDRLKGLEDRHREDSDAFASLSGSVSAGSPGRWLNRQTFTATGTYVPTPGTRRVRVRMCGGGGGGGGASATGVAISVGSGGSSGVTLEFTLGPGSNDLGPLASGPTPVGSVTVAAGGGPGSIPGFGANGGDTTLAVGGNTYTAKGGGGGQAGTQSGAVGDAIGGEPQTGSTTGTVQSAAGGGDGTVYSTSGGGLGWPGLGGGGVLGMPGKRAASNAVPSVPAGYGGGGCGAEAVTNSIVSGGTGAAGVVIIDEYS